VDVVSVKNVYRHRYAEERSPSDSDLEAITLPMFSQAHRIMRFVSRDEDHLLSISVYGNHPSNKYMATYLFCVVGAIVITIMIRKDIQ
jgi:hypothetical protein